MDASKLHVVGAFSNPRRAQVRGKLLRKWVPKVLDAGASLTIIEHAFGERPYEFTKEEFPHVNLVQIRGGAEHEVWLQHALYNRAIATLPDTAQYICWQDTDIEHVRGDWAVETLHMLQHHQVGQTWTHAIDLGPDSSVVRNEWGNDVDRSFCAAWIEGDIEITPGNYAPSQSRAMIPKDKKRDWRSHTGYSWAIRRDSLKRIGRLLDWLIAGSSDYHMALAFCGKLRQMAEDELAKGSADRYSPAYYRRLIEFSQRCDDVIRQDVGVVPGAILHGWHGSKRNRFYGAREDILTEAHFDPDRDVTYDIHGLPALTGDNRLLRDGLRRYGSMRNEDSVDP